MNHAPPQPQLAPGQTMAKGRYTVQAALPGHSAYAATDHEAFDRTVVLKALLAQPAGGQPFPAAARALAALRHHALPQVYAYFGDNGTTYAVMEYVEGVPLDGGPYPPADVLRWGGALCEALAAMHGHSPPLAHGDIRPRNLLLDSHSGEIRLVGIDLSGRRPPRDDVYALAVTLYQLASGDAAGAGNAAFAQLANLGVLGQALRPALQRNSGRAPTAAALGQQLTAARGTATAAPIVAPDGTPLADAPALVRWCERNWAEAAQWLPGELPDQLALWWGTTRLASQLRALPGAQSQRDAALDAALALLDPHDFGQQHQRIALDRQALDFFRIEEAPSRSVVVSNTGRRCAAVRVTTPPWLTASPREPLIAPGAEVIVRLTAMALNAEYGGWLRDDVVVASSGTRLTIQAQGRVGRWGVFRRQYGRGLVVLGFVLLCVLIMCGSISANLLARM